MSIAATIRKKLMIALRPTRLDIISESYLHAGHPGSPTRTLADLGSQRLG
jgi:BolA family transcriptional regulator, general stress-responsive regulator